MGYVVGGALILGLVSLVPRELLEPPVGLLVAPLVGLVAFVILLGLGVLWSHLTGGKS